MLTAWTISCFSILGVSLIGFLIYLLIKHKIFKKSDKRWKDSNFLSLKKFNKLYKKNNKIASLKKKNKYNSGLLIGSGIKKPLSLYFNPNSKFGVEKNISAFLLPKAHGLYFGTTGSGKTDTVLMPNLILNCLSKDKPSGLVFDPKGEIYANLAPFYRKNGYKVVYINLSETTMSHKWNPFQFSIDNGVEYVKTALLLNNLEDKSLYKELKSKKQESYNQAFNSVNETVRILIESSSGDDQSIWTTNSKSLFKLACLGMLETCSGESFKIVTELEEFKFSVNENNYNEKYDYVFKNEKLDNIIRKEFSKFTVRNIATIINETSKLDFLKFCDYVRWDEYKGLFTATDEQFASFKMQVQGSIDNLIGPDFLELIDGSSFSYNDLVKENTIIFINIPSTEESRKTIASLMVEQIYKFLEKYAKMNGGSLDRPFYFYLEELANCPKIQCLPTILTLGRGMKIFGLLVIQSIQQLDDKYYNGFSKIAWDNTMVRVYLLAKDQETLKIISSSCGNRIVKTDDFQTKEVPLLSEEDLKKIKIGESIVMLDRQDPIYIKNSSVSNYKYFWEWIRKTFLNKEILNSKFYKFKIKFSKKFRQTCNKKSIDNQQEYNNIYTPPISNQKEISYIKKYVDGLKSKFFSKFIDLFMQSLFNKNDLFSPNKVYRNEFIRVNMWMKSKEFESVREEYKSTEIYNDNEYYENFINLIINDIKKVFIISTNPEQNFEKDKKKSESPFVMKISEIISIYFDYFSNLEINGRQVFPFTPKEIVALKRELVEKVKIGDFDEQIKYLFKEKRYFSLWINESESKNVDQLINEKEIDDEFNKYKYRMDDIIYQINNYMARNSKISEQEQEYDIKVSSDRIIKNVNDDYPTSNQSLNDYPTDNTSVISIINNGFNNLDINPTDLFPKSIIDKLIEFIVIGKVKWWFNELSKENIDIDKIIHLTKLNKLKEYLEIIYSNSKLVTLIINNSGIVKSELTSKYNRLQKEILNDLNSTLEEKFPDFRTFKLSNYYNSFIRMYSKIIEDDSAQKLQEIINKIIIKED